MNEKETMWNEFIATKTELNNDIAKFLENIVLLFQSGKYEQAFHTIKVNCKTQVELCFELLTKANEIWLCDQSIYPYCTVLLEICQGILPLRKYVEFEDFSRKMQEIMRNSCKLSYNGLYVFIQTLEKLYALGYRGIGYTIFKGYEKLPQANDKIRILKEMSYVYVLNQDNFAEVNQHCFEIFYNAKKYMSKELKIQCWYYLGLIQEFEKRNFIMEENNICMLGSEMKNYMDRSYEKQFPLAIYYFENKLRNFACEENKRQMCNL